MTDVLSVRPLLTGTQKYDKSWSTHNNGFGTIITAPILAYLIETKNGRILYDVGCDYNKVIKSETYFQSNDFPYGPPQMTQEQRIPSYLDRLGIRPSDIDLIFIGHLHYDHVGGIGDFLNSDIHIQKKEILSVRDNMTPVYFSDDISRLTSGKMIIMDGDYNVTDGVQAISTPGHTAGHMSLHIELPKGKPIIICGDAADLEENIKEEIAPGLCWNDQYQTAISSIQNLKEISKREHAYLWPSHDFNFFHKLKSFPDFYN
ncbi:MULTISPECIES: N-acyl homoserine lactonase family protein [Acidithiobacillus]|uniref:N-acyl homoserine lactonase family protein n=1 Tax=Acidithiobacillus TaxID=119977 RepID=UPI00094AC328|nr:MULTISPECIES: N-acyl homoserine lactonase family protein [Acidithiobacillus]MBE7564400.1 N-acyl homoserine lactonase family protein [Acidithiobacillus sp. HP-6]MBE7571039.1 N-acyl homoserine lactonase family protein [Acidithiobacillus sp. HP-2]